MANDEHLLILKSGVEPWNLWRDENPNVKPDLVNADLTNIHLEGANLSKANLSNANLSNAKLNGVDFSYANLNGANLAGAYHDSPNVILMGANIDLQEKVDFSHANLASANLTNVNLPYSDFSVANLTVANLKQANLSASNFWVSQLERANLEQSNLSKSNLENANISEANLCAANLIGVKDVLFNDNLVRGLQIHYNSNDPWSTLRRTYSGSRLFFNLLFLIAFLIPYIFKLIFWVSVNYAQAYSETLVHKRVTDLGLDAESLTNYALCFAEKCEPMFAWQVILGVDKGRLDWGLAATLIFYNLMKAALTWFISPMRDEEERTGYTPSWTGRRGEYLYPENESYNKSTLLHRARQHFNGYRIFYVAHQFVRIIFWIALFAFLYHGYDWLSRTVWIPV